MLADCTCIDHWRLCVDCKCTILRTLQTQKLAEKQSMMYSLQRKLKSCRQALESKELHLGLVQKKVISLEDRLQTCNHRESDWEDAVNKV